MYVVTEPEPVMAIHTLDLLEQVVDSIGSPNFRLIFDPSHSTLLGGGDPFVFLKKFRGRMGHVHFTDTDGTRRGRNGTSKHLTLGDGTVDLLGTLRELKNQNYDKWIMLDLWNIPDIYRATIVGKEKLDDMLDILFPV
jgi:sugar phosphate isomerase/epimerase